MAGKCFVPPFIPRYLLGSTSKQHQHLKETLTTLFWYFYIYWLCMHTFLMKDKPSTSSFYVSACGRIAVCGNWESMQLDFHLVTISRAACTRHKTQIAMWGNTTTEQVTREAVGSKYIFTYNALDQTGYASPIDTILLTHESWKQCYWPQSGGEGVGMWKYAVGGGMDKAKGGRRKTRTLLSYNLRNLDQSNCRVIQYKCNKYGKQCR